MLASEVPNTSQMKDSNERADDQSLLMQIKNWTC